jgi:hypothetical protein
MSRATSASAIPARRKPVIDVDVLGDIGKEHRKRRCVDIDCRGPLQTSYLPAVTTTKPLVREVEAAFQGELGFALSRMFAGICQ